MTAHKHAALMLQYAQDAAETATPWERWEWSDDGGPWESCILSPTWSIYCEYRRKPQTIKVTVNGKEMEFPKPVAKNAISGDKIYTVYFDRIDNKFWVGSDDTESIGGLELAYINGNLCYLSNKAAQAHADVLNAICRGAID